MSYSLIILLLGFIALAIGLAWYLLAHDRGEKEPIDALWIAVGFGLVGALLAGFIEAKLVVSDNMLAGMPHGTIMRTALAVAFIEEICKFVPLAFFIYKKRYFNEHTDGVIYFALAGLAFGLPENILYTLQFGTKTGVLRLVLTPLFHAAATGAIGYFLAKRKLAGKPIFGIVVPLIAVSVLHGFYDYGLATGSTFLGVAAIATTVGLSVALFMFYLKATQRDQAMAISAVGNNKFCRSCGCPNPHRNLYCAKCGKNA